MIYDKYITTDKAVKVFYEPINGNADSSIVCGKGIVVPKINK